MTLKSPATYSRLHNRLKDILHDHGLEQLVMEPTRQHNTLDLIITNTPSMVPRVEVIPGLSDHDIVFCEFHTTVYINNKRRIPFPMYRKANWDAMAEDMDQTFNKIKTMSKDPCIRTQELWKLFETNIKESIKNNIPHKNNYKKDSHPWITTEIKNLIHKRDRTYRKMKKHGTEELRSKVKVIKRVLQQKLRRAHWEYLNDLFTTHDEESPKLKRFWSYIKHQKKSNVGIPPLKDKGCLVVDPKLKAEVLSRQFNTAFSNGKVLHG